MKQIPTTAAIVIGLARSLRRKLDDAHDWTEEAFKAADKLFDGRKRTVHACRRKSSKDWCAEYLVDLAISDDTKTKWDADDLFTYRQLILALECEWTPTSYALKYDFCKLADTRAVRKVFVGCVRSHASANVFIKAAARFLAGHKQVLESEEYGVLLFTKQTAPLGWVLTPNRKIALDMS